MSDCSINTADYFELKMRDIPGTPVLPNQGNPRQKTRTDPFRDVWDGFCEGSTTATDRPTVISEKKKDWQRFGPNNQSRQIATTGSSQANDTREQIASSKK